MSHRTPPHACSSLQRRAWAWWAGAWVVLVLYTSLYATLVWQHTALPYFDQAGYINKVYAIAERLHTKPAAWLTPNTYLTAEPMSRPPLMMLLPAWLYGAQATPRFCGEYWLLMRVVGLALAAWILARVVGTARIIPALLLTTLASWIFLSLNMLLYLMDPIFTSFGLLTFALVCWDMQRLTAGSAALCTASALALELIKPAGIAFEFPMFLILALRNILWIIRQHRAGRDWRNPTLGRAVIYGCFLLVLYYLLEKSPYGDGVRWQYAQGSKGYWNGPREFLVGIAFLIPGWLVLTAATWLLWQAYRRRTGVAEALPSDGALRPDNTRSVTWVLVCGTATLVWWLVFSVFLTYTFDPRITTAAMPIAVATVLVLVRTSRRFVAAVTALSAVVFSLSAGASAMLLPYHPLNFPSPATSTVARWLLSGPTWFGWLPNPQRPVRELGLIPLMRDIQAILLTANPRGDTLVCVIIDDFVEAQSLSLALRYVNAGTPGPIHVETAPWGGIDLNLDQLLLRRQWFLTKAPRHSIVLYGDAMAFVYALDALLTKSNSPLHPLLVSSLERIISQPTYAINIARTLDENPLLDERLTLWHLTRQPTPQEVLAALDFIAPMLESTSLAGQFHTEQARIKDHLERGIGVLTPEQAEWFVTQADPAFHDVRFEGWLSLLSVGHHRWPDDSLGIDLVWRADADLVLTGSVAVHLTDAHSKILGQADYRQDTIRSPVPQGTIWRDSITVPSQTAKGAVMLGLGVADKPGHMLGVSHPSSDWEADGVRHRLLVPLL
jgi:hypothetical protein